MKNLILLASFLLIFTSGCKRDPVASLDGWGPIKFGQPLEDVSKDLGKPESNEPYAGHPGAMSARWSLKDNSMADAVEVLYSPTVGVYLVTPKLKYDLDVKALKSGLTEKYGTEYQRSLVNKTGESWTWISNEKKVYASWRVYDGQQDYEVAYYDLKRQAEAEGRQTEAVAKEQAKQGL